MTDAPLMLSVSGLRGLVGRSLTEDVARRYAAAYGSWLIEACGKPTPHVVIGRDSRPSGQAFAQAAAESLQSTGCRVTDIGLVSTPAVAVMIRHLGADGGLVITASHNPAPWNGIKALRHDGVAPPPEQARQIIERFERDEGKTVAHDERPEVEINDTAGEVHVERVAQHVDEALIRQRAANVVLESVHGAGGPETALLLERLGADLTHLYAEPTGDFPHAPEPTAENLAGLCEAVSEHGADIGFAQDPDADRLAVVDDRGRYIGEEYTLALCAMEIFEIAESPICAVANLSTSRMIDDVAARHGGTVHRSAVGEANVAAKMRQVNAAIGGEGNGGVIWPPVGHVRDSLAGIALILRLMARTGLRVSELVDRIPRYTIIKQKTPIAEGMAARAVEQLAEHFAGQAIDRQDGIRIDLDRAWIHVRASNTEPIMRLIAEAPDRESAEQWIDQVTQVIGTEG